MINGNGRLSAVNIDYLYCALEENIDSADISVIKNISNVSAYPKKVIDVKSSYEYVNEYEPFKELIYATLENGDSEDITRYFQN